MREPITRREATLRTAAIAALIGLALVHLVALPYAVVQGASDRRHRRAAAIAAALRRRVVAGAAPARRRGARPGASSARSAS